MSLTSTIGLTTKGVEIEIGIELAHEPHGHAIVPEREHPERLARANDVIERVGDLVSQEERLLCVLLIGDPSLLEQPRVDVSELELEPLSDDDGLTERETRILQLLSATHLSQREIGRELGISFNTIKSHVKAVYLKLGACSRDEASQIARVRGLV